MKMSMGRWSNDTDRWKSNYRYSERNMFQCVVERCWQGTMRKESNLLYAWRYSVWNVMAHTQKPDFVFRRNGRVHLNRRGRLFSRLMAAELCASAAVMLDTPCSEIVWRVLATHSVRQFPLHFPFLASPCAFTFQLDSTARWRQYSSVLRAIS